MKSKRLIQGLLWSFFLGNFFVGTLEASGTRRKTKGVFCAALLASVGQTSGKVGSSSRGGCGTYHVNPDVPLTGRFVNCTDPGDVSSCAFVINYGEFKCGAAESCYSTKTVVGVDDTTEELCKRITLGEFVRESDPKRYNLETKPGGVYEGSWIMHSDSSTLTNMLRVETEDGQSMTLTPNHDMILSTGEFILAEDLRVGDTLLTGDGKTIRVNSIRETSEQGFVSIIPYESDSFPVYNTTNMAANPSGIKGSPYADATSPWGIAFIYGLSKNTRRFWQTRDEKGDIVIQGWVPTESLTSLKRRLFRSERSDP